MIYQDEQQSKVIMMNNNRGKRGKHKNIKKQRAARPSHNSHSFIDLLSSHSDLPSPQPDRLSSQFDSQSPNIHPHTSNIQEQTQWPKLPSRILTAQTLMVVGPKNTGKSTLSSHLMTTDPENTVLLDCDIGRNSSFEGCVSLTFQSQTRRVWVGELTPLNNVEGYLRGVRHLYDLYREKWFGKKLVVNTMGYTTGLGQILIYELFHSLKPDTVLGISLPPNGSNRQNGQTGSTDCLQPLLSNLQSGEYLKKIYFSQAEERHLTSTTFCFYQNGRATSKKGFTRFEKHFALGQAPPQKLTQLLQLIRSSHSPLTKNKLFFKEKALMPLFEQLKHPDDNFPFRALTVHSCIDMRLVVLGQFEQEQRLFLVEGVGFCHQGRVYSGVRLEGLSGVVCEGIDFEKVFYNCSEKELIDLELREGRLAFMMVMTKGLGSKGVRNNPSKVARD